MQKPRLIIGNKNYSSWSFRAWLVLAKIDLPFEEVRVPLMVDVAREELLRYSPSGKVPVYQEGDLVVWDTLAIFDFLPERHPGLWPEKREHRALARSISAEMHAGFSALREAMPMNCRATGRQVEITAGVERDIRRVQEIWEQCRSAFGKGGPWLMGPFSIADAMFAPVVTRFHTYGVPCPPTVAAYRDHVLQDPCVRQWFEAGRNEKETIEQMEVGGIFC